MPLSKNRLKYFRTLHQKKYRQEEQLFIVEGEKPLLELMHAQASWEVVFWGLTAYFIEKYEKILPKQLTYELISPDELHQLSTLENQKGGIAVVQMPTQTPIVPQENAYIIALDNIQDPGNLGTILRLADWYGFPKVVCSENCVEVYNPKTILASMGSFLRVQTFYTNLPAYLLENKNFTVLGAVMQGENLHKATLPKGGILVLGNEGHGISPEVASCLNMPLTIPRFGKAESLNVAMATAVFLDRLAQASYFVG
jgi:TrmH family RNA methyltransferase